MTSKRAAPDDAEYPLYIGLFRRNVVVGRTKPVSVATLVAQLLPLLHHLLRPRRLQLRTSRKDARGNIFAVFGTDLECLRSGIRSEPAMIAFEAAHSVEVVFDLHRDPGLNDASGADVDTRYSLAVFDMDSTLIQQEVIDEVARSIGRYPAVSAITERAMNGELDFEASLRERVALLSGVSTNIWNELKEGGRITLTEGARSLTTMLKQQGAKTAVVSGGFIPMAEWVKDELGLDYAFSNHLESSGPTSAFPYEHLTGKLLPGHPIITPEKKRLILCQLAKENSVPLSRTLVVGDGSNDLPMMHAAGLGVAWNAKERVQREAPNRLNGASLAELCLLLE